MKECLGERPPVGVPREATALRDGVGRSVSLRGDGPEGDDDDDDDIPNRAGSTATAPGNFKPDFLRLDGGTRLAGRAAGTGSFSIAL